ncbi:MAG: hypothetical protein M9913_05465 [Bryobacteraceae bacterium]|nr:hypothetical protein [Bryobacteraceae bacterium]MCO5350340.1 hypothetical protein [Bryobacteraceae bacterium]
MSAHDQSQFKVALLDSRVCAEILFQLAVTRFLHSDLIVLTPSAMAFIMFDYKQMIGRLDHQPTMRRIAVANEFVGLAFGLLAACSAGAGIPFMCKALAELNYKRIDIRRRFDEVDHHNHVTTRENTFLINAAISARSFGIVGVGLCALVASAGTVGAGGAAAVAATESAKQAAACCAITKLVDGSVIALTQATGDKMFQQFITTGIGWVDTNNRPYFLPATNAGIAADYTLGGLHGAAMRTFTNQLDLELSKRAAEAQFWLTRERAIHIDAMNPELRLGPRELHSSPRKWDKAQQAQQKRLSSHNQRQHAHDQKVLRSERNAYARSFLGTIAVPLVFLGDDMISAYNYYHDVQAGYEQRWRAPKPPIKNR